MKVIDHGHLYGLQVLDAEPTFNEAYELLRFVKREGEGYPGNLGHHPGTNCQEVLRAVIHRLEYLDKQIHDIRNGAVISCIKSAIYMLEERAADRHKRDYPTVEEAVHGKTCEKCGHVGCQGECH